MSNGGSSGRDFGVGERRRKVAVVLFAAVLMAAFGVSTSMGASGASTGTEKGAEIPPAPAASYPDETTDAPIRSSSEQRDRSRTAYRDLDDAKSSELIEATFGDYFKSLRHSTPSPDGEILRYRGKHAALVRDGDGSNQLLYSTSPLWALDGSGNKSPLDLSLRAQGDRFAPTLEAGVTRFPKNAVEGISVASDRGDSLSVDPRGDSTGRLATEAEAVIYPNIDTDTDLLVAPQPSGLSFAFTLRSETAPEQTRLKLGIDSGLSLTQDPDTQMVTAERKDGTAVWTITPPAAVDADGYPVETRQSIDGNDLVLSTDHHGADTKYPILVDPTVLWYSPGSNAGQFWTQTKNNAGNSAGAQFTTFTTNNNLFVGALQGTYANGTYGQWAFSVPHYPSSTAGFSSVTATNFTVTGNGTPYWPAVGLGLATTTGYTQYMQFAGATTTSADKALNGSTSAKSFVFHMRNVSGSPKTTSAYRFAYMTDLWYYLVDNDSPTAGYGNSNFNDSPWVGSGNVKIQPSFNDPGLGVRLVDLSVENSAGQVVASKPQIHVDSCFGAHPGATCPQSHTLNSAEAWNFDTSTLPNGNYTVKAKATDPVGNVTTPAGRTIGQIQVDRQNPSMQLSGGLSPNGAGGNDLTIEAHDNHSGVRSVDVEIKAPEDSSFSSVDPDALVEYDASVSVPGGAAPCDDPVAGGCSRTIYFNPENIVYPPGAYKLRVSVEDQAGLTYTDKWSVDIEGAAPHVATQPGHMSETAYFFSQMGANGTAGRPALPGAPPGWDPAWQGTLDDIRNLPEAPRGTASTAARAEISTINRLAGNLPKLAGYGKFAMGGPAGFVTVTVGTFVLGKIFSPGDTPNGQVWNLNRFELKDYGETLDDRCWTGPCNDPADIQDIKFTWPSRVFVSADSNQSVFYYCTPHPDLPTGVTSPAGMLGGIPEGAQVVELHTEPSTGSGTCGPSSWVSFTLVDPLDPEEFLPVGGPSGPGGNEVGTLTLPGGCTATWPCESQGDIAQSIEDALNSGNFPAASATSDAGSDEQFFPPRTLPETENENHHKCDRPPGPAYEHPDMNEPVGSEYTIDEGPLLVTNRPPLAQEAGRNNDIYLHLGFTRWEPAFDTALPRVRDEWSGWGLRKIRAKHGWTLRDELETKLALETAVPVPAPGGSGNWNYVIPVPSPGSFPCFRTVAVDFKISGSQSRARGIVTSFTGTPDSP